TRGSLRYLSFSDFSPRAGRAAGFLASSAGASSPSFGLRSVSTPGSATAAAPRPAADAAPSAALALAAAAPSEPSRFTSHLAGALHAPAAVGLRHLGLREVVADHERGHVGVDPLRDRRRQARDGQLVQDQVQDALLLLDTRGLTDGAHGPLDGDGTVRGDLLQVDVQEHLGDRVELQIADDRHPRPGAVLPVEL